jgi:hypothetical protein
LAEDLAGGEAAFAEQMTRPYGPPLPNYFDFEALQNHRPPFFS